MLLPCHAVSRLIRMLTAGGCGHSCGCSNGHGGSHGGSDGCIVVVGVAVVVV
jgi:hypothetical protein